MATDALRWKATFTIRHYFNGFQDVDMEEDDPVPEGVCEPVSKAIIEFAKKGDERLERLGEDIAEVETVGDFNACLDFIYGHCNEMRWLIQ